MQPTQATLEHLIDLFAADDTLLASLSAMKFRLIINPFNSELATVYADLTFASFTGSAAKTATAGAQTVLFDPLTGMWAIQILEPAGGLTWVATAAIDPTQTVYGITLENNAMNVLIGTQTLDTPVPISQIGDSVTVPNARLRFLNTSPF